MLRFIKENIFIAIIFLVTLSVGFFTFLTFINKSFIALTETTEMSFGNILLQMKYILQQ